MNVIVERSTLTQTDSGSVIGSIWLQSNEPRIDFPEAGWTDFPVLILGWWLAQVEGLLRGASTEADCLFMDGPFEFRINSTGEIRLLRKGASATTEIAKGSIPLEGFWQQLNLAASEVISECERQGFSSGDVVRLRQFVRER